MRRLADRERIRAFMAALGKSARSPATVYLVGGATAVLHGWRDSTIDIDCKLVPDREELLRAIALLKDEVEVNVELASPDLFIPVSPGWEERSAFIQDEGRVQFRHFDYTAQALAKIERGHQRDLEDVRAMLERGLVTAEGMRAEFARVVDQVHRYPALHAPTWRRALEAALSY